MERCLQTISLLCAAAVGSPAQVFTTLANFDATNGYYPVAPILQATDGNFYGMTEFGGPGSGTVFRMSPTGVLTMINSLLPPGGAEPFAGLIEDPNGKLYGTTNVGGANKGGTIFDLTLNGALTTVYAFAGPRGANSVAPLLLAADGNFYGTTEFGGVSCPPNGAGCGIVFQLTPSGTLTVRHEFSGPDGQWPAAGLIQAANGNLYGTTMGGGANGDGTVFEITPAGALTTLHSFSGTDGSSPLAALVQANNGSLYGTTSTGGTNGAGTIFEITAAGVFSTFHTFAYSDGAAPFAGLIQATDGNLYGTTSSGGANQYYGTVFEITLSGSLTTLHSFGSPDGAYPEAELIQGTDGMLYGTTFKGGTSDFGTVFSLSVGLGPFVETLPTTGKVAQTIGILGTNLTGVSAVHFHGVFAEFTVVSPSLITAVVPSGATSGTVEVSTQAGLLASNVAFRVIP